MSNKEDNTAIELRSVSKIYRSYPTPRHRLLELLSGGRKQYFRETRALDDVSFSLEKGGRLGIVGENGSGKSTLLKILAGVLTPSQGKVTVNGRVSALLELGAGFNPELSGRENINQFCMLHGMQQDEITDALPEIIQFSELRGAVEHPVKTYSSGMAVRLGFACSVYVQPDILIVDEALSVGDAYFQNKCLHKIRSMLDAGITFIYVTHAADAIRSLCTRGLWLDKGKVRLAGSAAEVGAGYQSEMFNRMVRSGIAEQEADYPDSSKSDNARSESYLPTDRSRRQAFSERVRPLRTGSGEIRIDDICVINDKGEETDSVDIDRQMRVRVFFHVKANPPERSVLNLGITDNAGRQILHFNPMFFGIYASDAPPNIQHMIEFRFPNPLCPGEYGLVAGIATLLENPRYNGQTMIDNVIDYCPGASRFTVRFPVERVARDLWGLMHVNYTAAMYSLD